MIDSRSVPLITALVAASALTQGAAQSARSKTRSDAPTKSHAVTHRKLKDRVRVEVDGALFTEFIHLGHPSPVLYPIHGPGGVPMTRSYPMAKGSAAEATDHPHHRSLWFAHGSVNGHDFWSGKLKIKPLTTAAEAISVGGRPGVRLQSRCDYLVRGQSICSDQRVIRFFANPAGRFIDYEVTLNAHRGDVVFGDTKEGTMAIRLAPTLRVRGKAATGTLKNSTGIVGKKVWGKRADWIDNYGRIGKATLGVAIFDHPRNHGHPCRWHARDYGLLAANPFGIHHFEGAPKGTGDFRLKKGKSLRLRYRFFFHRGSTQAAAVAAQYVRFATQTASLSGPAPNKPKSEGKTGKTPAAKKNPAKT